MLFKNWKWDTFFNEPNDEVLPELKMYVLVRQDLDETYRCVQGSHAVCKYALEFSNSSTQLFKIWNNRTIIFLGVTNYKHLKQWQSVLVNLKKSHSSFCEPDLDDQLTSIACIDIGDIFSKLPLAK